MRRNKLYALIALACTAGYAYLFFSLYYLRGQPEGFGMCAFKKIAGVPCPSCGSTRAVKLLVQGDFYGALMMNPLGIVSALLMILLPLWVCYDLVFRKQTLYESYQAFELTVRVKWIATVLALLILANWYWNIQKDL